MKYFLLLLAAQAAVCIPPGPSRYPSSSCIEHCSCKLGKLPNSLQITECDKPLILDNITFKHISKSNTNVISLDNVIINQIQESAFSEFKNLGDIIFTNTKIGSIDANTFMNVTRVKFANCGFEDSPELSSKNMEEIQFASCNIERIPDLNGLIPLTFLNLSGNYIKYLGVEAFSQLFDLEELHLSNNEISRIAPSTFINNQELITLNLDNNPLQYFHVDQFDSLEILSLKNCQIEVFDSDSTSMLPSLNDLNLSYNYIREILPTALSYLQELSIIDLSYNKLTKLEDNIFAGNGKVKKIILDGNNFERLPTFYRNNKDTFPVMTFSCKYCNLTNITGNVFSNMDSIMNLDLSHNNLRNVFNLFEQIRSLRSLDISYNKIVAFDKYAFVSNRKLAVLNIAGNPLKYLNPESFFSNRFLRDIDARNASLVRLWSNYDRPLKSLQKLLLGGNKLQTFTSDDFSIMPKLEAIELQNNPLVFDGKLCALFHLLELEGVTPIDYNPTIYNTADKAYREDIDTFTSIEWKEIHKGACPDVVTERVQTPEIIHFKDDDTIKYVSKTEKLNDDDNSDDEYDDYYTDEDESDDETSTRFLKEDTSLAKATYILSVTSVFVLSALVVLTMAVTITLCILRRNNKFGMQKANLPRLKIPLWNTTPGQKKHSGSVYRPLSEDRLGPQTPKLNRYEFTTTPEVHTA